MSADATRFMAFAFASADLLLEIDGERRIAFALGATSGLTDRSEATLVGTPLADLFAPADRPLVDALLDALAPSSRCGPMLVQLVDGPDGVPRKAMFHACRLPLLPNAIACTIGRLTLASAPHALKRRSERDVQLLDSAGFGVAAANLVETARVVGKPLEMTFVEMSGLEALKRRLPKAAADELVSKVAALLRAASVDGSAAGRLGAERFGVVHEPDRDPTALGERLAAVARQVDDAGAGVVVRPATLDLAGADMPADATERAVRYVVDRYAANGAADELPGSLGQAFETLVTTTLARVRDFTSIVRDSRFSLSYQPIVTLATGRVHHFEMLARFNADESPTEIIQFAEEIGIIERFDLAVVARAIEALKAATMDRRVAVAVNVSGRSIENVIFVKCLLDLLDGNLDLAPRLAIEITESVQLKDLVAANAVLQEIRCRGFKVCLDDFGAGSASFQYLQALTIDFVKIDGAYVRRLGSSPRDSAMIKGLVGLCSELGIGAIAEMVETRDQVERLKAMGVSHAQGWYFGKPAAEPVLPWDDAVPATRGQRRA
jgi:EAL domain-containing protein (putative c-di-GMP-specific phosphodiesterase class I)/GGDEF domain-containing protein